MRRLAKDSRQRGTGGGGGGSSRCGAAICIIAQSAGV